MLPETSPLPTDSRVRQPHWDDLAFAAQACGVAPLVGTLQPDTEADLLVVRTPD